MFGLDPDTFGPYSVASKRVDNVAWGSSQWVKDYHCNLDAVRSFRFGSVVGVVDEKYENFDALKIDTFDLPEEQIIKSLLADAFSDELRAGLRTAVTRLAETLYPRS